MPVSDELLAAADQSFIAEMQAIDSERNAAAQEQSERYRKLTDDFVTQASEYIHPPVNHVDGQPATDPAASPAAVKIS